MFYFDILKIVRLLEENSLKYENVRERERERERERKRKRKREKERKT
jgi:hypothetical protein